MSYGKTFSTVGIHPRTLTEVQRGSAVIVRDAHGEYRQKIAASPVVPGGFFMVVWACRPEEWEAAEGERREPNVIPWPAEDVWLPDDVPQSEDRN